MATFKDHKVTANQLLGVIPEGLLSHLSDNTKTAGFISTLPFGVVLKIVLNVVEPPVTNDKPTGDKKKPDVTVASGF